MPAGQRGPLSTRGTSEAGGGVPTQSVTSSAATPKPSGRIRSFLSLSAWGSPTPVVALACTGNVDIQVFSGADGQLYFVRRLQVCISRLPFRGAGKP